MLLHHPLQLLAARCDDICLSFAAAAAAAGAAS
jgi:hypothetical protein